MPKKSFKIKIIIPTIIILVALVVIIIGFFTMRVSALSDSLIDEKLTANANNLKLYIEDSKVNSKAAAVSMAMNPHAIKAIKDRDTNALISIFTPTHDMYRVNHYTITDNGGVVLARTHESLYFGDSALDQQSIRDALSGSVSTYLESSSAAKVSVSTGAPVYDNGTLIGVISAGVRFDTNSALEELKKLLNCEVTVYWGNKRIASTIINNDGESIIGVTLDPVIEKIVIENKKEYIGDTDIFGKKHKAFYMPLIDFKNEVFAAFFLGIPETEIKKESNKFILYGIILGIIVLLTAIALLSYIISLISEPITKLTNNISNIVNGNLGISIDVKSEDEVGYLAQSLQKIADILHKLLDDINHMISEQEKGNTEYSLNADEFLGDYKILADNILDLAELGMRDQMTGIPNKRGFDKRLDLEWNRAIREKTLISILMIDLDKFKNYNDTFGNQQGDAALKAIAKTIKQSTKRSIDFAARWGGGEFVILLPTTDSIGAMSVAANVRTEIENSLIPCEDPRAAKLTVSIGVNTLMPEPTDSIGEFISIVNGALYKAKETGRNRVVLGRAEK